MDHADRPARGDADPDVRGERQRLREPARQQVALGGEPHLEPAGRLDERAGHDVARDLGARDRRRRDHRGDDGGGDEARRGTRAHARTVPALAIAVLAAAACQAPAGEIDGAFYDGDGRAVHCALGIDTVARNSLASIDTALDRAAARGEIVELYAHDPGRTVPVDTIAHVLAGATARGLAFVTYADFVAGAADAAGPGLALSFDDTSIASWYGLRDLLRAHGARVTFFVSRFHKVDAEDRALLRALADDGHDVQAHSVLHLRAPEYVEDFGLAAYVADEALPSIEALRAEGFAVTAYAYPFGARTGELDRALLAHVPLLRSVSFSWSAVIDSPCPR